MRRARFERARLDPPVGRPQQLRVFLQNLGQPHVVRFQCEIQDGQGPLEERLGLRVQALAVVDGGQRGEVGGQVGVRPPERRLHDRHGALVVRLGLGVDHLLRIERSYRREVSGQIEVVGAERRFDDLRCLPVEHLGFGMALFRDAELRKVVQRHRPPQVGRGKIGCVVGRHQEQLLGFAVATVLAGVVGGLHVVLPLQPAAGGGGETDDKQEENEDSRPMPPWVRDNARSGVEHPTAIIGSQTGSAVERTGT